MKEIVLIPINCVTLSCYYNIIYNTSGNLRWIRECLIWPDVYVYAREFFSTLSHIFVAKQSFLSSANHRANCVLLRRFLTLAVRHCLPFFTGLFFKNVTVVFCMCTTNAHIVSACFSSVFLLAYFFCIRIKPSTMNGGPLFARIVEGDLRNFNHGWLKWKRYFIDYLLIGYVWKSWQIVREWWKMWHCMFFYLFIRSCEFLSAFKQRWCLQWDSINILSL